MKNKNIMIVSKPGNWQRIIVNHISKFTFINISDVVSGSLTAAERVDTNSPDLLLIDSSIAIDDVIALIKRVKSGNKQIKIIAIADTNQQRERIYRTGADFVFSSFSFEFEIDRVMTNLLDEQFNLTEGL